MRKYILLICGLIFLPNLTKAQEEAVFFTVDRPGIADLPYIVQSGQFQFEMGLDYIDRNNIKRVQLPSFQFRTGISDKAELRISVRHITQDSLQDVINPFGWTSGITPLTLGIKIPFVKEKGIIPEIALMTNISLPFTGDKSLRPSYAGHDLYLLFNHNFNQKWSLNYNLGVIWEGFQAGGVWTYSMCLSYQPKSFMGVFIEQYTYLPDTSPSEWGADAGFTFLIAPRMQLDISGGYSKNKIENYYFLSSGVSFRLDRKKSTITY